MKLWCCLCFNEEEEEEERRNLVEPMKKEEDIFVNVGADDDEAEARNDEAGFLEELAMVAPLQLDSLGSWSASRRSEGEGSSGTASRWWEGEGSSGAATAVAAAGSESPAADESRDLSHKRAKFYNECHFAAPTSSSNVKYSLDYGDCDLSFGPSSVTCYNDFALMCTGQGGNGEEDSSL